MQTKQEATQIAFFTRRYRYIYKYVVHLAYPAARQLGAGLPRRTTRHGAAA